MVKKAKAKAERKDAGFWILLASLRSSKQGFWILIIVGNCELEIGYCKF